MPFSKLQKFERMNVQGKRVMMRLRMARKMHENRNKIAMGPRLPHHIADRRWRTVRGHPNVRMTSNGFYYGRSIRWLKGSYEAYEGRKERDYRYDRHVRSFTWKRPRWWMYWRPDAPPV